MTIFSQRDSTRREKNGTGRSFKMSTSLDANALKSMNTDQLVQQVLHFQELYNQSREEFDEMKASSAEIEKLLEMELEQKTKELSTYKNKVQTSGRDSERAQEKLDESRKQWVKLEESLRKQIDVLQKENLLTKERTRELEQRNDDLERHERNNQQLLEDFEKRLNDAIERSTLLENELAERQQANEEMYRLREELRGERPRLVVGPLRVERSDEPSAPEEPIHEKKRRTEMAAPTSDSTEPQNAHHAPVHNAQGDVPESKGFAGCVNRIVKDLMVKVDRLESVLSGLRVQSKGSPQHITQPTMSTD
ncbi:hypothetical protein WR25_26338 [Diploscapter pachys]|uniref:NUDE domain-containing protein n=1 Tax=Diploscapter pachys TaxID=2018661 RepID=A0A2A2KUB7_9BILA|nr:hypothetical protein WR25_26338 [Diploscapter pachys]